VLAYPDVGRAADDVVEIHSYGPTALEGFQDTVVRHLREKGKPAPGARFLPDGGAWPLAERLRLPTDACAASAHTPPRCV
jgi:hypothetical protein